MPANRIAVALNWRRVPLEGPEDVVVCLGLPGVLAVYACPWGNFGAMS
jgi:hypothetical protein